MKKTLTCRFENENNPAASILFSGQRGHSLNLNINDAGFEHNLYLCQGEVLKLHEFLTEFLQEEEASPYGPTYEKTGRALAVMDADTLDILRIYRGGQAEGMETETYESLCAKFGNIDDEHMPENKVFIFFDTFEGSISMGMIRRILRACISYQVDFVRTGDFSRCRRMILKDIEDFTTIDVSNVSRSTQDVTIISAAGLFTLDSTSASLARPSLFDEGSKRTDGSWCSRKEVLALMREFFASENRNIPITDEAMSRHLHDEGYDVARRTVVKYRDILGIPNTRERKID